MTDPFQSAAVTALQAQASVAAQDSKEQLFRLATSPLAIAVVVALLVAVTLYLLAPPFTQQRRSSQIERAHVDLLKLLLWSAGAGVAVLIGTLALDAFRKRSLKS